MPITPLTDRELNALIAYIKSLSEQGQTELEQEQSDGGEA